MIFSSILAEHVCGQKVAMAAIMVAASVLENLSTNKVPRLRLGIGSPENDVDVIEYVLGHFDEEDQVS